MAQPKNHAFNFCEFFTKNVNEAFTHPLLNSYRKGRGPFPLSQL
jgi:hypothetical protein